MNRQERSRLARLEGVVKDVDFYERRMVERLNADGWAFKSMQQARNHLAAVRTAARVMGEQVERMSDLLRDFRKGAK